MKILGYAYQGAPDRWRRRSGLSGRPSCASLRDNSRVLRDVPEVVHTYALARPQHDERRRMLNDLWRFFEASR